LQSIRKAGSAPREVVAQLCSLAGSGEAGLSEPGTQAIFAEVVEPLCDEFLPESCDAYVRFFCTLISECRGNPAFASFDRCLSGFGLSTEQQLVERAFRIRDMRRLSPPVGPDKVAQVLLPSRVTLGADIAITSVAINRAKQLFPSARIVLLGSRKAGALFASDARVDLIETDYRRGGALRERFEAWVGLAGAVAGCMGRSAEGESLLIDPDSRLTQLGLLPLVAGDKNYYFFESRGYAAATANSLGALTSCWLDEVFSLLSNQAPGHSPSHPSVSLPQGDLELGRKVRSVLKGPVAAVNLGVGDNLEKRIPGSFELHMLQTLLANGYRVVLDRGAGDEELERTKGLVRQLEASGKVTAEIGAAPSYEPTADLLTWEGSLHGFGGLIAAADLYAGYDSAGGHLAAALDVPVIDIFTSAAPKRMRERWTPWGRQPVHVITADATDPRGALSAFEAAVRERRK
jgi:ADP-heptose:LPS heptosyltransferase